MQVEQKTEERAAQLNRVKHVEKERDALEGPKNEAEEFLAKEQELNRKRAEHALINEHKTRKAIADTEAKKAELQVKADREREKSGACSPVFAPGNRK